MTPHALDAIPSSPLFSGVPMDIMLVIFDILRQSCESEFKINWVFEVTHVCRSWRNAALLSSFLWTDIDVEASVSWAVEFARRSRQAPINIILEPHLYWSPELYECTMTLLRENRPRIREIHLSGVEDEGPVFSTLSACGSVFFPILESLKISIGWYDDYEPSFILTNNILHAPNLKTLSLMHCGVEEGFASIHNISYLSITENTASKNITNFLRKALPQMVNLETLSLFAPDEFIDNDTGFGTQVATLPKLYNIEIGWPIEHIISILQMISYGPQRKMQLTAILAVDRHEQALRLFTCFISHAGANLPRLRLLYDSSRLRVCDLRGDVTPVTVNFCLSIKFPYGTHPQSLVDLAPILLGGLVHRMDHQTLQALSLGVKLSTQSWVKVFGTLPLLARIRIINPGEQEFFAALINEIESGDIPIQQPDHRNATATLPFQGLRAVKVVGRTEPYLEEEMAFILRCLRVRKERGYKLKKLHFTSVAEEGLKRQLGALRRVVGSLEVHK